MSDQALGFDAFKLNKQLLEAVTAAGYTQPTPIQEKAIPLALPGMMCSELRRQVPEKRPLMSFRC